MSTLALAADGEVVEDSDTYVSSALTFPVQAILPVIDDGAGDTVAIDTEMRFETTAAGSIEILNSDKRRVGIVPGRSQAIVVARTGVDQNDSPQAWSFQILPQTPAATVVDGPTDAAVNANTGSALAQEATDSPLRADVDTSLDAIATIVNANAVKQNANAVKQDLIAVALNKVIAVLDGAGFTKVE